MHDNFTNDPLIISCDVIMIKYLNFEEVVLEKSSCTLNMAEKRRSLCDPAELFRR